MATGLSANEEAQLSQTIEMFEVITQSQPLDWQSLEILKEAYTKLNKQGEVVTTSKRIAQAYVQLGQLSSAILEYESILQRYPDDPDVKTALAEIEIRASSVSMPKADTDMGDRSFVPPASVKKTVPGRPMQALEVDDGRQTMYKHLVDTKLVTANDFNLYWPAPNLQSAPTAVVEPLLSVLHDKQILTADRALKHLIERTRLAWLPIERYDVDVELARTFPRETCYRWSVIPFDRMSKSVLVATCNPFNKQAAQELEASTKNRLIWYLASPGDLVKTIKKVIR